jgi:hypothetical protein
MVTLDQDDLPFARSLLDCYFGLVVLDQETSLIRLVHKSLQDFLDSNKQKHDLFENGHRDIARSCLRYMSFHGSTTTFDPEIFESAYYVFRDIIYERWSPKSSHIQKYPFLTYAIKHWGHHARIQTDQEVIDLASRLLPNNRTLQCISHKIRNFVLPFYRELYSPYAFEFEPPRILTENFSLHLAIHFGADKLFQAPFDLNNQYVDKHNYGSKSTPLLLALRLNRVEMVRLLLARDDIEVESAVGIENASLPLLVAVECGYDAIVRRFLERNDVNIDRVGHHEKKRYTALHVAVIHGHENIVRLLVARGADVNLINRMGNLQYN